MTKRNSFLSRLWINLRFQHRHNQKRGLYGYLGWNSLKIVAIYIIIIVPLIIIARNLFDFNGIFGYITDNVPSWFVLLIFFISESFLGMIPPDLFMIWSTGFDQPFLMLFLLGVLSYLGGIVSYWIGYWLSTRPKIRAFTERKLEKYIILVRKWGGAFIVIAALFPFSPLSLVIIAVSLLKYPFKSYLVFGLSRILRFLFQGLLYLGLFNMDAIFNKIF